MRVECDRCHRVAAAHLTVVPVDGDGRGPDGRFDIAHACEACGASTRYQPPGAGPVAAPGGRECPKCDARVGSSAACPRCGLAADRMDGFVVDEPVPASLEAAWATCRASWDDPAAHDRVAELALVHERYPWLARHYRTVLRDRPDDAVAAARLARIARMAEAAMRATASPPAAARASRTGTYAIMILAVLVIAAGLFYAVRLLGARGSEPAPRARTPAEPVRATPRLPARPTPVAPAPPAAAAPTATPPPD